MRRIVNLVKRIVWKVLWHLSRPIKASNWYKSKFVDFDHEIYPDNVWYREHDERNFEVVNLGSSGGKWGFDWEAVGVKGMNWAQQPQTLIDDFRLLKNFHSILKKNGFVIITIMPFSGLNKTTGAMDTFKYLNTLYWDVIKDMPHLAQAQRLAAYPILFGKPAIKAGIKRLLKRERKVEDWRETLDHNPMSEVELAQDAENWMRGWAKQFGIANFEAPLTPANEAGRKIRVRVLQDLVDFCLERGYRPIYVIPPVETHLAAMFTPKFKDLYIKSFLDAVGRDIPLLDYTDDMSLQSADLYFNSFFLNVKGRKIFTQRVWKDLHK